MAKKIKKTKNRTANLGSFGTKIVWPDFIDRPSEVIKNTGAKSVKRNSIVQPNLRIAGMMNGMQGLGAGLGMGYGHAYSNSYASGNINTGTFDIPPYIQQMNNKNGGVIYFPTTLREKYTWYRFFARTNPYVGRALDLMCDLPMSRMTLNMPTMNGIDPKEKRKIEQFYEAMCRDLSMFKMMRDMLWERNTMGNCFIFSEWSPEHKRWTGITILPPEEIEVRGVPFSQNAAVTYRPEHWTRVVKNTNSSSQLDEGDQQLFDAIPDEIKSMLKEKGCIEFDSTPITRGEKDANGKVSDVIGSFIYHIARRKTAYHEIGSSILERVLVSLLMQEHYQYTQLGIASRNMTPRNKITAPGLNQDELNELRDQVDFSYLSPEYAVMSSYEFQWDVIEANNRLLELSGESERIENRIFAGLGFTREILTGEGTWSGNRITIELMNQMFLMDREEIKDYVENQLFMPVALANGWYRDVDNIREYFYPRITFNRLSIRDNNETFDVLFQLYQKGSLPIDTIYEVFNLDPDALHAKLKEDAFTIKDPTFNRLLEGVNDQLASRIVDDTDIFDRVVKYLKLENMVAAPMMDEFGMPMDGMGGGGFDMGGGGGGAPGPNIELGPGIESSGEDTMAESDTMGPSGFTEGGGGEGESSTVPESGGGDEGGGLE